MSARQDQLKQLSFDNLLPSQPEKNGSGFSDPAFAVNKQMPVHRWVPWIAGFSMEFVQGAISRYIPSGHGTVLDPFSGVGTTLVESILAGHDAIGFEINPYAAFSCQVKLNAYKVDLDELEACIDGLVVFCRKADSDHYVAQSVPPKSFRTRDPFYSPAVLRKVLVVHDFIATIENGSIRDIFRLAFASTMVRYSNYSYEPSLGRRVSAGKSEILDFPVAETIAAKLRDMAADIRWMKERTTFDVSSWVINASFFDCQSHVEANVADLIITSPPYLNNYHYNRNTRPQLYWLGLVQTPQDLQPLEEMNFGKFWQTVRESERVDLAFSLPNSEIADQLEHLQTLNPERGIYGGNGWANYAASYFNDCWRFSEGIKHVLKRGGTALVVIGNSILQGVMIPTDRYFGQIAQSVGLTLVDIHTPRETRVGNSIIRSEVRVTKAKDSHQLYEAVIEVRKD
jgi:DNA modification methylase